MKIIEVFKIKKEKIGLIACCLVMILGIGASVVKSEAVYTMAAVGEKVVVLDAGHGGWGSCLY